LVGVFWIVGLCLLTVPLGGRLKLCARRVWHYRKSLLLRLQSLANKVRLEAKHKQTMHALWIGLSSGNVRGKVIRLVVSAVALRCASAAVACCALSRRAAALVSAHSGAGR
jgi:hypothetical protein